MFTIWKILNIYLNLFKLIFIQKEDRLYQDKETTFIFNVKVDLYQLLTEIKFESEKLSHDICHFSSALKVVT